MFIPFLPLSDAHTVLEIHFECEAQRGEIEAELGSGYFLDCRDAYQASWMAREETDRRAAEFDASPEGERYNARVEAAHFMVGIVSSDMRAYDHTDLDDMDRAPWGASLRVPEFIPGLSRSDFIIGDFDGDDLPF